MDIDYINRHNRMIKKANTRIEELEKNGLTVFAQMNAQGITIEIHRPSPKGKKYTSISFEIIPY